jgi:hypothetical protein
MNQSNSQLFQDIFALKTAKNKTYIEIGAAGPIKYNNTYQLEIRGWKGFSIEFNDKRVSRWDGHKERKNKIYCADAIKFNYTAALIENQLPNRIGYLSCDIEPPENTFAALRTVFEQGIMFDCITFEHDKYQSSTDIDPLVTDYVKRFGYRVAVRDVFRFRKYRVDGIKVKVSKKCIMETWYIKDDINFEELDYNQWRNKTGLGEL